MRIVVVGMNHRSAPLEIRERFMVDDPEPLLTKLVASDEIEEAVLISTCNRIEVVALTRQLEGARERLRSFFRREIGANAEFPEGLRLEDILYEHNDSGAMRHVFRVASSLDSMVVGEPQILGQVKDAYRAAARCQACGVILHRFFNRAFATAKRVRSETRIAERPVSVARVAVDLAKHIFEELEDKQALLLGAGEMSEIALGALRREGLSSVRIANRTRSRAVELAQRFDAAAFGLDDLPEVLAMSDVVICSLGGTTPILPRPLFESAMHGRPRRPMFVIDIAVPRNVDPDVNDLDGVYLYDIDDLEGLALENAEQRQRETNFAEAIVIDEQQRFDGWLTALKAVPTIRHLRARGEEIRRTEIERAFRKLELDERQRQGVEALTRSIVNKLLHAPTAYLNSASEREEGIAYLEAVRALFRLDEESGSYDDPDSDTRSSGEE